MIELTWLDHLPAESLESGVALLRSLRWHIEVGRTTEGKWVAKTGHSVIFRADSRESLDAFLYGMSLAYSVMPEHLIENYRAYMLKEEGGDAGSNKS